MGCVHRVRDSLVVNVTDSWWMCHDFEPSTTLKTRLVEGSRCTLNALMHVCTVNMVWKLGEGLASSGVAYSSLNYGSQLRDPPPTAFE
ncbi:hypothetical protein TNCV_1506301 [Trichonephila clavipes]|nr:hypothetical protein TNCV_1506301 [Trichonephila clavipes]